MTARRGHRGARRRAGLICYRQLPRAAGRRPVRPHHPRSAARCSTRATCSGPRSPRALPEKQYVETALRIIDAPRRPPAHDRGHNRPIGLTAEELRDELACSRPGLPERDAFSCETTIETHRRQDRSARCAGQFISIERGERPDLPRRHARTSTTTSRSTSGRVARRGRARRGVLPGDGEILGVRDDPYVAGYRIWQYELPWAAKNGDRAATSSWARPTSARPRSRPGLLHLLPPAVRAAPLHRRGEPDEVFLRLGRPRTRSSQASFGATPARRRARPANRPADRRPIYEQKSPATHHQEMVAWLQKQHADRDDPHLPRRQEVARGVAGRRSRTASIGAGAAPLRLLAHPRSSLRRAVPRLPNLAVEITPDNLADADSQRPDPPR